MGGSQKKYFEKKKIKLKIFFLLLLFKFEFFKIIPFLFIPQKTTPFLPLPPLHYQTNPEFRILMREKTENTTRQIWDEMGVFFSYIYLWGRGRGSLDIAGQVWGDI